jgi:hypothetical protein
MRTKPTLWLSTLGESAITVAVGVYTTAAAIKTGTVYDAGLNEEQINSLTRIPF